MIVLYSANEAEYLNNGFGAIADDLSCTVTQELNGGYELTMKYPVTGARYAGLVLRNQILCPPDRINRPQPFRIYRISSPLNGVVTVYARHVAYDLQGIVDAPFSAPTAPLAMEGLATAAVTPCPFTFSTDKSTAATMTVSEPTAIWSQLSGRQGSVLDTYGGEFEFDRYNVILHNRRGADRGVRIAYGKNLTSYTQDQNNSNVWTAVYPYWTDGNGALVQLPERLVQGQGAYDYTRVLPLDFTEQWQEPPTEDQLRARAETYVAANDIGVPTVSWKIGFAQLEQSPEYAGSALFTGVQLGDTVRVDFPAYEVSASARVVALTYDVHLDRYTSVTIGSVKSSLAQTIAIQEREISERPTKTIVEAIATALGSDLLGGKGGIIRLLDTDGDGYPDELYIGDNPDPALAVVVWRWNKAGWAVSKNGYSGEYLFGATLESGILANAITAAMLTAGIIKSADDGKTFYLDLDNGILRMDANSISINGEAMSIIIQGVADDAAAAAAAVQSDLDDLRAHIVIGADGSMTFVGASGNPITLRLVNDRVAIYNGGAMIDSFAADGTTTQNLTIPDGGRLSIGDFALVTKSGLSLMWVG